jgi:hypothetical protein
MRNGSVLRGSSWWLLGCWFALIGCGSSGPPPRALVPATGFVKYKGKPVAGATVMFAAEIGNPAMGMTDETGAFKLTTGGQPGVVIAKCKVTVTKPGEQGAGLSTDMKPSDMEKMIQQKKSLAPPKGAIPARYATPRETPLEADISEKADDNVFVFSLVD